MPSPAEHFYDLPKFSPPSLSLLILCSGATQVVSKFKPATPSKSMNVSRSHNSLPSMILASRSSTEKEAYQYSRATMMKNDIRLHCDKAQVRCSMTTSIAWM